MRAASPPFRAEAATWMVLSCTWVTVVLGGLPPNTTPMLGEEPWLMIRTVSTGAFSIIKAAFQYVVFGIDYFTI